jgi:membrane-bound lytic murein transglycosylase A
MAADLQPVAFEDLGGWTGDDHAAAFRAFRLSAGQLAEAVPRAKELGIPVPQRAAAAALQMENPGAGAARRFFERWFDAVRVVPHTGDGFVTGYYEPEVEGRRVPDAEFGHPIYARPEDLVELGPGEHLDGVVWGRCTPDGLVEHPDRAAIEAGALRGRGLELVYLRSEVEAFFVHVQGSARVRLAGGETIRLAFAGKSGHPYTAIARLLVAEEGFTPAEMTADRLRAWLDADPRRAARLMRRNRSFIFFAEMPVVDPAAGPLGAAGVALTAGRSLAVDRALHSFHVPVFVEADLPPSPDADPVAFRRLLIAQDTGSAIVGPARGDIFFGAGEAGFRRASPVRHAARFTVLVGRQEPRP